jgi:hypothetical protein
MGSPRERWWVFLAEWGTRLIYPDRGQREGGMLCLTFRTSGMNEGLFGPPTPFVCLSNRVAGSVRNPAQLIPPNGEAWDVDFAPVLGRRRQHRRFASWRVVRTDRSFGQRAGNALEYAGSNGQ